MMQSNDTYTILNSMHANYGTGTLIPIQIPQGSTYDFGIMFKLDSNSISSSVNTLIYPMGGVAAQNAYFRIRPNIHNYYYTYRMYNPNPLNTSATGEVSIPSSANSTNWAKLTSTTVYYKQSISVSSSACTTKLYGSSESSTSVTNTYTNSSYSSSNAWNANSDVSGYWCFGGTPGYSASTGYCVLTGNQGMKGKIFKAWITIDGVTRDFFPAIKDRTGEIGLYCESTKEFYPSVSENPFTTI